ncbi:MAG: ChbG/HpnK family deacetylase [Candidatus Omnitrophica bacterium]|nr:ChbG/HpnK family deacetylase [Candidatus Omnitrophota bacterium]
MSKKLAITADDFGLAEDINRAIVECYRKGVITNISLLAVGEAYHDAVRRAKENGITKLGAHLAITDFFKPVSSQEFVPSLVGRNGLFTSGYQTFLCRYLAGFVNNNDIYSEFKNQIAKIKNDGFSISHLNTHQHVHMVPGILKIVTALAEEEKVEYVRFPREKLGILTRLKEPSASIRNLMLLSMCLLSEGLLKKAHVKYNDYFAGHAYALRTKKKYIYDMLSETGDGLMELNCHIGYFTENVRKRFPYYKNCEKEMELLCDEAFLNEIKSRNIKLVSY